MGDASALETRVARELDAPVPAEVTALADEIRRRHGAAVAAILFYGSCLRRGTADGVLDFYALVDDYRSAHRSRALAVANALLPPNVVYLELPVGDARLRAKVAIFSRRAFARRAAGIGIDTRIWARFAQPARLVFARDEAVRREIRESVVAAVLTFVDRLRFVLPADAGAQPFDAGTLWRDGLRETYRAELRSEPPETIAAIERADPARYEAVARDALRTLAARGRIRLREDGGGLALLSTAAERARARRAWALRRPLSKALGLPMLVKTAFTFDDWVSYVLWKLERHGGGRIETTERQRRHPFVFGWPVLFRLLRRRVLR